MRAKSSTARQEPDHDPRRPSGSPIDLKKGVRSVAGGLVWALVYDGLWGIAWLWFMRREWSEAASWSGRILPWTHSFWVLWVPITVLFGVAITLYLAGETRPARPLPAAAATSLVVWVPGTVGMAVGVGFSLHVLVLDSAVNFLALLAASAVVAAGIDARRRRSDRGGALRRDAP